MGIDGRMAGQEIVVVVTGDRGLNGGDGPVAARVREVMERGRRLVVLDMRQVQHIDSRGVGALVEAFMVARNRGGSLRLSGATRRVNDVLSLAGLSTMLTESTPRPRILHIDPNPRVMH